MSRPMTKVKIAQRTIIYPWNFSHPLVVGITIAGTETKKEKKTTTAFAIVAVVVILAPSIN